MARPRLSIPTRIFFGFILILGALGVMATLSLLQHRRTAGTLRLLDEGYLPLALRLGQSRADQNGYVAQLDRLMEEEARTRSWLEAARRLRLGSVRMTLESVDQALGLLPPPVERRSLERIRGDLTAAAHTFEESESKYEALTEALGSGDRPRAEVLLAGLRETEAEALFRLRSAGTALQERIATVSSEAAEQERQAAIVLGVLTVLSLAIGIAITWWSQRLLAPLPRLQQRVAAVARGDLASQLEPATDDELGRLQAEFERMVDALAARDERLIHTERLAAIGRMAAHVTHEVRNPLSSIGLNIEMLQEELKSSNPEVATLLRAVQSEIDRLTAITEEYLRLARLPPPHLEPTDLGEVIRGTASFVRKEMDSKGIDLRVKVESGLPTVAVNEAQIRQALLNLLRNAREAMPQGGTLTMEATSANDDVIVRVTDTGHGLTAEHQQRAFDLFYTTKEGGTGLGLPLTKQIVVAHGGRIRVESGARQGTTFEITFPGTAPNRSPGSAQLEPR